MWLAGKGQRACEEEKEMAGSHRKSLAWNLTGSVWFPYRHSSLYLAASLRAYPGWAPASRWVFSESGGLSFLLETLHFCRHFALASVGPWANQYAAWNYLKPDALVTTNLLPLGVEKAEQGASFFGVSAVCFPPHVICTRPLGFLGLQSLFPELSLMEGELSKTSRGTLESGGDKGQGPRQGRGPEQEWLLGLAILQARP